MGKTKHRRQSIWLAIAAIDQQTFQVPKTEVLTYISCMDTAYVRETPPPKIAFLGEPYLYFRYLKILVNWYSLTKKHFC